MSDAPEKDYCTFCHREHEVVNGPCPSELAPVSGSVQKWFHTPTVNECARLCDWKIICLGADIHPAAKRALEELKIHILALNDRTDAQPEAGK